MITDKKFLNRLHTIGAKVTTPNYQFPQQTTTCNYVDYHLRLESQSIATYSGAQKCSELSWK
jgi:hypothetical protein